MSSGGDRPGTGQRRGGPEPRVELAASILDDFAQATGLTSGRPPRRYLWTDALAVCTWLGLYARTGAERFRPLALRLVDQVHHVLGRHRPDDPREGWISGLDEEVGERHPTAGGLRIGKELPERAPGEPHDPRLEWDRDGQYYHYLTRWMHALQRVAEVTAEPTFHRWAVELAAVAHGTFAYRPAAGTAVRLHWKMSIDGSRPLVAAMGAHDPLDGLVTCLSLAAAAPSGVSGPERDESVRPLVGPAAELAEACEGRSWVTDDALGIGGLLLALHRVGRMQAGGRDTSPLDASKLARDALESLTAWGRTGATGLPAPHRLAFRELGMALGLRGAEALLGAVETPTSPEGTPASGEGLHEVLPRLAPFLPLAASIEDFWVDPDHQRVSTWTEHRDINRVSLAASLVPEGWLGT